MTDTRYNPAIRENYYGTDRHVLTYCKNFGSTILELGPRSRSEKRVAKKIAAFP